MYRGIRAVPFVQGVRFAVSLGTINVGKLGFMEEGIIESLLTAVVKLVTLQISSAGFLMFGAFAAIFLWTGAFLLVEWGETDGKKAVRK